MKKIISVLLVTVCCFCLLPACGSDSGKTNNVKVTIGNSTKFTKAEIQQAVSKVKGKFKDFKGCELKTIIYDENESIEQVEGYLSGGKGSENGAKAENTIVLFSDFHTGPNNDDGLNDNFDYTHYMWILIRDSKTSSWKVDDCGY